MAAATAWSVRLLGAIEAHRPGLSLTRWPSRTVALLLARLALAPDRIHPREELIDMLWPGVSLDVGRNRLRQVLSTLKKLLEQAGHAAVIHADRQAVRALPGTLHCDARDFERQLRAGDWAAAEQAYGGDLMPGYYEEWVNDERSRLSALADRLKVMPRVPATVPAVPAGAAAAAPGRLPSYWTRLFGTEINASRLRELVRHERLVTVFGAGGSGKSRLAVEAARSLREPAAWAPEGSPAEPVFDRVTFVSLVDCIDAPRAVDAIAAALQATGRDPLQSIANGLAGQRTLLVLDNFEQLVGVAEDIVHKLLTDVDRLHVLVTSRQRLGIDGEHVFELTGLPAPAGAASPPPSAAAGEDALTGHAAVALFVDRARAAASDFALTPTHESAVVQLVRLLSGMPLAIELAASRMRSLTPAALLTLLTDGTSPMLDLLARDSGAHSVTQRHASMRHVVAWSWRQLGPPLVTLMEALATFAAPALAETVAAVADLDVTQARERLEQLRDHSLVVAQKDERGTLRYVLLQPVREFVVERTDAALAARMRRRLRAWLLDFGRRFAARGHHAIDAIEAELPLVYAAILGAAADGPDAQRQAVQIAVALRRHWEIDTRAGLPLSVMRALQAALPECDEANLCSEACILLAFSSALAGLADEGLVFVDKALALTSQPRLRAQALVRRVHVIMFSHGDRGMVDGLLAEAVQLAQAAGDLETQGLAMRMQFLVAVNRDDDRNRGEVIAREVQALWERLGHRRNAYSGLMDRASCWIGQGRLDEAATALAACEQVARQERHATGYIMSSWQLGRVLLKLRLAEASLAAFRRCLQGSWDHMRPAYVADALVLLPGGLAFAGGAEDAARLQGFAVAHWQQHFGAFYRDMERDVCMTRRWLRHTLGAVRLEALRLEGACLNLSDAVMLGLGRRTD